MPDSSPWRRRHQVRGVGADRDVRAALGGAHPHARAVRRAADLPGVAHVAQAHVVGRVEARLRARDSGSGACGRPLGPPSRASARTATLPAGARNAPGGGSLTAPCAKSASTTPRRASVRPLEPREPGKVGIYACGPTVYARVHVGNARPFVVFSQLKRFLEHEGLEATLVANITDINDKIYDAARAAGRPSAELARGDDRPLRRRHGPAGARAPGPRAAGLRERRRRSST